MRYMTIAEAKSYDEYLIVIENENISPSVFIRTEYNDADLLFRIAVGKAKYIYGRMNKCTIPPILINSSVF